MEISIATLKQKLTAPAVVAGSLFAGAANAAGGQLDEAMMTAIKTSVTADATTAIGAGFALMAVVLGAKIAFSLAKTFISAGAR
nr:hypothetical protein [Plesiomonas shigelloides]